ncbi:TetR/AcrR family transcriptional regulator [Epilithonimonas hispanica]|uniref:TetR/AcrR family transcriptional regulator n=1 Tax=Epilithonimonas hispanica TaxID=358687 RepID=A0A3D9CWZ3_9FLAO|nr:TetR/AcrR family transcriptional regulator [Epilithonimonas hispanica]REC70286.1 TetR/AcrR family transcriptional regulator [Epilithonimonas hispanica]
METKQLIVGTANNLLIERGFNAFSYKNISEQIGIKTSSIHYHFPSKTDLGIALIKSHHEILKKTIEKNNEKTPLEKLKKLFLYYERLAIAHKVCIIGAFTSDINTLEESVRGEILTFANSVVDWANSILEEGQRQNVFKQLFNTQLKAKLLIANLMSLVQLARIEKNNHSFEQMMEMILDDLTIKTE